MGATPPQQIAAAFLFALSLRIALLAAVLQLSADGAPIEIDWWMVVGQAWVGAGLWTAMDRIALEKRPDPYASPGRWGTYALGALAATPVVAVAALVVIVLVARPYAAHEVEVRLEVAREHVDAYDDPARCAEAIDRFSDLAERDRVSMRAGGVGLWLDSVVREHLSRDAGWRLWCTYAIGVADGEGQPPDMVDEVMAAAE